MGVDAFGHGGAGRAALPARVRPTGRAGTAPTSRRLTCPQLAAALILYAPSESQPPQETMASAVETLSDNRVRIRVEVPVADVDHSFEHALRDLAAKVKIPGFRNGKVPMSVVRQRLGHDAIVEEALRGHLDSWLGRELDVQDIEPVSSPQVAIEEPLEEGNPFVFSATVAVPPVASLPDPLVLEAPRGEVVVAEEEIQAQIDRLREAAAELAPIEDASVGAADGHLALIDVNCVIGGKTIREASTTDYLVEVGSGQMLDELDAGLQGMTVGETREVEVTMPESAPKRLAGKTGSATIALKELKERVLPEEGDDLAQAVTEFQTLAELRADIENSLRERAEHSVDATYRAAVLAALGRAAVVSVPDAMIGRRIDERIRTLRRNFAQRGLQLEQALAQSGMTPQMLFMQIRPEAEQVAREELALKAYADRLKIDPNDEELSAWVLDQASSEEDPTEAARRVLEDERARKSIRNEFRLKLALDQAVESATPITYEQAEARARDAAAGVAN